MKNNFITFFFILILQKQLINTYLNDYLQYSVGFYEIDQSIDNSNAIKDTSIYQQDAILQNSSTLHYAQDVNQNNNNSLDLSILNSGYLEIENQGQLSNFGQNWSFSIFIQGPETGLDETEIIIVQDNETSFTIYREDYDQVLGLTLCSNYFSLPNFFDDQWKHLAITVEQGIYLSIAIDSQYLIKDKLIINCIPQSQNNICVGAICDSGNLKFIGKIDKIGFFKKTLSLQEINYLYTQPNCPFYCQQCSEINGNLNCDVCKGDRILRGNICVCTQEHQYDDMQSELCQDLQSFQFDKEDPLVLYLPLDSFHNQEFTMDASGQFNRVICQNVSDGTEQCLHDNDRFGNADQAVQLHSSSSTIELILIEKQSPLQLGREDFTISFWIKVDQSVTTQQKIMCGDGGDIIEIVSTQGQTPPIFYLIMGGQNIAEINSLIDNNWHFIAIVRYDQTRIGLMQGFIYEEFTMQEVNFNIQDSLQIGNCLTEDPEIYPFVGQIDEIRIYKKKIEYIELREITNYPNCPNSCTDCTPLKGRLVCNQCRGNRIFDENKYQCICPEGFQENPALNAENCDQTQYFLAYYNMDDGDLTDLSSTLADDGQVNTVSIDDNFDGNMEDRFNNPNKAMDFSLGEVQLVLHNKLKFLYLAKSDFTISMWIKGPVLNPTDSGVIFINGAQNFVISRQFITTNIQIGIAESFYIVNNVLNSEWNFFSVSRDNINTLNVYINNQLSHSFQIGNVIIGNLDDYYFLGYSEDQNYNAFDGYIDDFRIYRKNVDIQHRYAIMSFPECPVFCQGCVFDELPDEYIGVCEACKGNRIFDDNELFCICPDGYVEDFQSEDCIFISQYNPLILYYSFNSDITDLSQNLYYQNTNNNGITQGILKVKNSLGQQNRAYEFQPDIVSIIQIANTSIFNFNENDFTISFWVKASSSSNYPWGQIIGNNIDGQGISIVRFGNTQDIRLMINELNYDIPNVLIDEWVFLNFQKQEENLIIQINENISQPPLYLGEIIINSQNQVCIGRKCDNTYPFDGQIDELYIFEQFIDQSMIQQIKNYECSFSCLECDIRHPGNVCLSCQGDRILQLDGSCLCPDGKFDDFISQQCQQCPDKCSKCNNLNECTLCVDSIANEFALRIIDNLCQCPQQGYYETQVLCNKCYSKRCISCNEQETCNSCVGSTLEKQQQRQQSRICECPVGYYDDFQNDNAIDCIPCSLKTQNCISCDQQTGFCLECKGDLIFIDGLCKCPKGTYPKDLSNLQETECQVCQSEKATCNGGYEITLKKGYWRESTQTDNILLCYNNQDNCIGGSGGASVQLCKEGHTGALCEACDIENQNGLGAYANSSQYECSPCDNVSNNNLKIIGVIILQMVLLYLSVIGTLTATQQQIQYNFLKLLINTTQPLPDEMGVLIKILQNYLFVISAIVVFQIEIPDIFSGFITTSSTPAKTMALSFDCALASMQQDMPVLYLRILWQLFVAFLQLIFVNILGLALIKLKKTKIKFDSLFWTSLIYQYISLQPSILSMTLEAMACRKIGDESYILSNTSMKCSGDQYMEYTIGLLLPFLLIWVIVIPFLLFQKLRHQVKQINKNQISKENLEIQIDEYTYTQQFQLQSLEKPQIIGLFGFLYLEYKKENYYWEFIKIFQRVLISAILSFYYTDIYVKGILVFMTVIAYTLIQKNVNPYKIESQNKIDQISMQISSITLIIGLFLYENNYDYWIIIGAIFMIVMNLILILFIINKILKAQSKTLSNRILQFNEKIDTYEQYIMLEDQRKNIEQEIQQNQQKLIENNQQNVNFKDLQDKISQLQYQLQENKNQQYLLNYTFLEDKTKEMKKLNEQNQKIQSQEKREKIIKSQKNKNQKISSVINKIQQFQVKYLGQVNQNIIQQSVKLIFELKANVQQYIDGVQAGYIEQLYQQKQKDLNQNQFSLKKSHICTAQEFLDNRTTMSQKNDLKSFLKSYNLNKKKQNYQILNQIKIQMQSILKDNKIESKYFVNQIQQKQSIEILENSNQLQFHTESSLENKNEQNSQFTEKNQKINSKYIKNTENILLTSMDKNLQNTEINIESKKDTSNHIEMLESPPESKDDQTERQFNFKNDEIKTTTNDNQQQESQGQNNIQYVKKRRMTANLGKNIDLIEKPRKFSLSNQQKPYKSNLKVLNQQQIQTLSQQIVNNFDNKEIDEFLQVFKLLDTSNNSLVSKYDIAQLFKNLGFTIYKGQIEEVFDKFNIQEDQVDFVTFISTLLLLKYQEKPISIIHEIFSRFDLQRNGTLGIQEVQNLFESLTEQKISDKTAQQIILMQTNHQKNVLNVNDFINLIL